jgi:hypothetical protein
MDNTLRTPMLDFFRRGDAARDVRLMAAQGAFAPRPLEQLGLLMILVADGDGEIRATAEATLSKIPPDLIAGFIARPDTPDELRAFFVSRGIAPAATALGDADSGMAAGDDTQEYGPEPTTEEEKLSMLQQLSAMSVPEKVKAAMKGSREMRAVLIRDPNKMVSMAVLSSPKMTEAEIEAIAKMGAVSDDVLRVIGQNRAWTKNYNVVLSLVKNAKTPVAMSLNFLSRLNERDLRALSISRAVPEPLRIAARKRVVMDAK